MMKQKHNHRMEDLCEAALSIIFAEDDDEGSDGDPPEIIVVGDP